jgi:hypothetical protein
MPQSTEKGRKQSKTLPLNVLPSTDMPSSKAPRMRQYGLDVDENYAGHRGLL